jgi:predicted lipoprotein with Yx(FWY)xxD motif
MRALEIDRGRRPRSRRRGGGRSDSPARSGLFRAVVLATGLLAMLAFLAAPAGAAVIYPPVTGTAVKTAEGFELKGTVYNYGGTTSWHFEYGTTTAYGTSAPAPDADAGTALASSVSQLVTGLAPDTTYHYRLVSDNSVEGIGDGADQTFSTVAAGNATPPPTTPGPVEATTPTEPPAAGSGPERVAKAVTRKGRSLLATTKGRTLYSLSAEKGGKFICTATSSCTSIWTPLTVASGVVPQGPVKLGTIRRPEGTIQVTYKGHPLYTFAADKKPGQTKGEGIKDVGTWHAALLPTKGGGPGSTPATPPHTYSLEVSK